MQNRSLPTLILSLVLGTFATSCQTAREVTFAYRDATYGGDRYQPSNETSVLFLVDGLSSDILKTSLQNSNVPQIANAFTLSTKARFNLGRAVFPSLTFPNITSVLTGSPVSDHPIIGNRVLLDDRLVNFENPSNWNELTRRIYRQTIFTTLSSKSESSVSYAYAFSGGATAFQEKSIEAGVSYLEEDYAAVDFATLSSLRHLLTDTQVSKWPRFIFVHLIGIDALAHRFGPESEMVQTYLHELDSNLGAIFGLLDHPNGLSASTRSVNYALTADHGFRTTSKHSPLADVVSRLTRKVQFVADNRTATLRFMEQMNDADRVEFARSLLQVENVGWAAVKTESSIELLRRNGNKHGRISFAERGCKDGAAAARFEWLPQPNDSATSNPNDFVCLSDFSTAYVLGDDSYILPALVDYFASTASPDVVFIPNDQSDFASGYAGNHGGLTPEEMLVPMLTKDVEMPRGLYPTYELLKYMGLKP